MSALGGCTVISTADGGRCGRPAESRFKSSRTGEWLYECAEHDTSRSFPSVTPPAKPKTVFDTPLGKVRSRSTRRYILVSTARPGYGTAPYVVRRSDKVETLVKETRYRGGTLGFSHFVIDTVTGEVL